MTTLKQAQLALFKSDYKVSSLGVRLFDVAISNARTLKYSKVVNPNQSITETLIFRIKEGDEVGVVAGKVCISRGKSTMIWTQKADLTFLRVEDLDANVALSLNVHASKLDNLGKFSLNF